MGVKEEKVGARWGREEKERDGYGVLNSQDNKAPPFFSSLPVRRRERDLEATHVEYFSFRFGESSSLPCHSFQTMVCPPKRLTPNPPPPLSSTHSPSFPPLPYVHTKQIITLSISLNALVLRVRLASPVLCFGGGGWVGWVWVGGWVRERIRMLFARAGF